jgi:hypothetical protein
VYLLFTLDVNSSVSSLFSLPCALAAVTHGKPGKVQPKPSFSCRCVTAATASSSAVLSAPIFSLLALYASMYVDPLSTFPACCSISTLEHFSFASSIPWTMLPSLCGYPSKQGHPKHGLLLPNCTATALACSTVLGPQALALTCDSGLSRAIPLAIILLSFSNRGPVV